MVIVKASNPFFFSGRIDEREELAVIVAVSDDVDRGNIEVAPIDVNVATERLQWDIRVASCVLRDVDET